VLAARNNADWCRAMCRAHGLTSNDTDAVWSCPDRTPPYYPDAVTLRPDVTRDEVLAGVDAGPGCSVKDSFGTLDLAPAGFVPIITATWLYREVDGTAPSAAGWRRVEDADALAVWVAGWGGDPGVFRAELLADPDVAVLARYQGGEVTAGAVANRSPNSIGISNLYGLAGDLAQVWRGAVATAYGVFDPRPVVGYEHGDDLAAAVRAGCTPLTDLRIWLYPPPTPR
jgi:hypothetical protein